MRACLKWVLLVSCWLTGCTTIERGLHLYSADAPSAQVFDFADGERSVYYTFNTGAESEIDTWLFFYGGSGCSSWKAVMPGYVAGLNAPARVFVLNKRGVSDRATGLLGCDAAFHRTNSPEQWVKDYSEFLSAQWRAVANQTPAKLPRRVVLVGVSEGALPAIRVAALHPEVTHVVVIGHGGYTMRQSLKTLRAKGVISWDVDAGWAAISSDPRSLERSWYGLPYRWWSDLMDHDVASDYLKLKLPILLGMGERDESVPVESALELAAKFQAAGQQNLTLRVFPGADHRLQAPGQDGRRVLFGEVARWLNEGDRSLAR